MKTSYTLIAVSLSLLLIQSCSRGSISIRSTPPGANVLLRSSFGAKQIGKTPLELKSAEVANDGRQLVELEITMDGFLPKNIMLPTLNSQQNISIQLTLEKTRLWLENQEEFNSCSKMSGPLTDYIANVATTAVCPQLDKRQTILLAQTIAETQSLIIRKDYQAARQQLTVLATTFPYVSVIFDLLGNIAFVTKDFPAAVKNYEKSLKLEPDNSRTRQIIEKIRRMSPTSFSAAPVSEQ